MPLVVAEWPFFYVLLTGSITLHLHLAKNFLCLLSSVLCSNLQLCQENHPRNSIRNLSTEISNLKYRHRRCLFIILKGGGLFYTSHKPVFYLLRGKKKPHKNKNKPSR